MKIILIIFFCALNLFASFETSNNSAFQGGLANSTIAADNQTPTFLINPATSSASHNFFAGISYYRPYGLSELNSGEFVITAPFKNLVTGIDLSTFGSKQYRENRISFNLSTSFLNKKLSAGANFHWYHITVQNYQNSSSLGLDVGVQYKITPGIFSGFAINNVNQPKINGYAEEIPVITTWGFMVKLDDHLTTHIAVRKESWFAPSLLLGVNFFVNQSLSLQTGFNTYPSVPSLGFKLNKSKITIYYSFQYHMLLGATHYWGISFGKKQYQKK